MLKLKIVLCFLGLLLLLGSIILNVIWAVILAGTFAFIWWYWWKLRLGKWKKAVIVGAAFVIVCVLQWQGLLPDPGDPGSYSENRLPLIGRYISNMPEYVTTADEHPAPDPLEDYRKDFERRSLDLLAHSKAYNLSLISKEALEVTHSILQVF